jgi:non-homologous end joining protein Ku
MVALAKQLIQRQTTTYDPADLEDRYETALKKSLAQEATLTKAAQSSAQSRPKRAAAAQAARPGRKRA